MKEKALREINVFPCARNNERYTQRSASTTVAVSVCLLLRLLLDAEAPDMMANCVYLSVPFFLSA